jgi:hypothetical protein
MTAVAPTLTRRRQVAALAVEEERALDLLLLQLFPGVLMALAQRQLLVVDLHSLAGSLQAECQS